MKKVSKASVKYRPSTGARKCGNCAMLHDGVCSLVAGPISKTYVCDRWEKK